MMSRRLLRLIAVTTLLAGAISGVAVALVYYAAQPEEPDFNTSGPLAKAEPIRSRPEKIRTVSDVPAWPNLFGPTHDHTAPAENASPRAWDSDGPEEMWRVPCGTGYSSLIAWDDSLILLHRIDEEEIVECLDAKDGSSRWQHRYPSDFVCGSHYTSGPYSTPATNGNVVVALGAEGVLNCLNLADGSVVWTRQINQEFDVEQDVFGAGHSPLIWKDRVILNVGGGTDGTGVMAFRLSDGETVWGATDHGPAYATPQPARIHGRDFLFVFTKNGLVSLDPETGDEYWQMPYESKVPEGYTAVTPVVYGDLVLVTILGKGTKVIRIAEDGSFSEVWESKRVLTSQYTPILSADGFVYGVHSLDKSFRCVDLSTGELVWRWRDALQRSTQIIVGDKILLFGEAGELALVQRDPEEFTELARTDWSVFPEEPRCYCAPAYVNGKLYLRSESEAVCYVIPVGLSDLESSVVAAD